MFWICWCAWLALTTTPRLVSAYTDTEEFISDLDKPDDDSYERKSIHFRDEFKFHPAISCTREAVASLKPNYPPRAKHGTRSLSNILNTSGAGSRSPPAKTQTRNCHILTS